MVFQFYSLCSTPGLHVPSYNYANCLNQKYRTVNRLLLACTHYEDMRTASRQPLSFIVQWVGSGRGMEDLRLLLTWRWTNKVRSIAATPPQPFWSPSKPQRTSLHTSPSFNPPPPPKHHLACYNYRKCLMETNDHIHVAQAANSLNGGKREELRELPGIWTDINAWSRPVDQSRFPTNEFRVADARF